MIARDEIGDPRKESVRIRRALRGISISDTSLDKIPGAKGKNWDDLERQYPLLRQRGAYIARLFSPCHKPGKGDEIEE